MNSPRLRFVLLLAALFFLSLGLPFWMVGSNNKSAILRKQTSALSAYDKYVTIQKQITSYVLSDNIVKSSLVQFYLGSGLALLQNHLADLQKNFPGIKMITLFDRNGRHYLSTEYSESGDLTAMDLLKLDKPLFNIRYARSFNQYVFVVMAPLMNDFNFRIGYLELVFSLEDLVSAMGISRDLAVFFSRGVTPVFTAPPTLPATEFPRNAPSSSSGVSVLDYGGSRYLAVSSHHQETGFNVLFLYRQFNKAFYLIIVVNILLFALLVFTLVFYAARRRETEDGKKAKSETDDLLNYSQQALRNVYLINELVDEVGRQKTELRDKLKGLNISRVGSGTSRTPNDFKIIEPI